MDYLILDNGTPMEYCDSCLDGEGVQGASDFSLAKERLMSVPNSYPIDIVTIEPFTKRAARLLTAEKLLGLKTHLAANPEAGKVIPHTGGMRKLRWGMEGRGKRRGARVIYYYRDLNMPLFLVAIYAKNEQANLSNKEKKEMRQLVDELVQIQCSQKWANIVQLISATGS